MLLLRSNNALAENLDNGVSINVASFGGSEEECPILHQVKSRLSDRHSQREKGFL